MRSRWVRPVPRLSVRLRATLTATAVVAVALVIATAALVGVLQGSLRDSAADDAIRRAETAAERLAADSAVPIDVLDPDVVVLSGPVIAAHPISGVRAPVDSWAPLESYAVATAPVDTADGVVVVQARSSLQPAEAALGALAGLLVPGVPALLLLVAGLTWLAVGRALAPVSAIRRELADITASDLHRRVPVPEARDEIASLAETTNRTLDRLEQAVGRQQRFVADAAHELRSPLAVLRTRLEIAPPQPLTGEALADVDRIQRLATDLLLLARLDAGGPPGNEEVDLGQVAAEEASRARPRPGVRVSLQVGSGVVVQGSDEQLRRLVTNLVDNAVRHAEQTVVVRLVRSGHDAVLEVGDDGPGIPSEDREAVFDRFTRLDEARARETGDRDTGARDAGGSGLGLAIARDIATRHGGTLAVVSGPPGACLRARLPIELRHEEPLLALQQRSGRNRAGFLLYRQK